MRASPLVVLLTIAASHGAAAAQVPEGLVAWWRGEDAPVECLSGAPGTAVGNVTYADGKHGRAFSFDGSSYLTVSEADVPACDFTEDDAFTYALWFYRTSDEPLHMHVFGKRSGCGGGQDFYQLPISSNPNIGLPYDLCPLNEWTFLVQAEQPVGDGTYHGRAWINGKFLGEFTRPYTPQNNGDFRIGRSGTCSLFFGRVDEMMLFNRALSDEEALALYQRCHADVDLNGTVDFTDLLCVLSDWGNENCSLIDIDGDGVVGFSDLLEVLTAWGDCR